MNENQVFLLFFLQNVLNFLFFYFFTEKYSQMFKDLNVQFQNTTQMFLDHLSDMYYYGYYGYNNASYTDEDEYEDEDEDEDEEGGDNDKEDEDDKEEDEDEEEVEDVKEKEQNLFQSG